MLCNRCTGIYKFGNNTYPRRIRRRSNMSHFLGKKSASYGSGNTVILAKYGLWLPNDGFLVNQNMLEQLPYFKMF